MKHNPHLPGSADEFIENNMGLAQKVAWGFYLASTKDSRIKFDKDDFESIAYMGLIKAYERYDPKFLNHEGRAVQFSSYAVAIIRGCIMVNTRDYAYTIRNKDRQAEKVNVDSLDEPIKSNSDTPMFKLDKMGFSDNYDQIIISEFESKLNEKQIKIFRLRLAGFSQSKIGRMLGCTQVQIGRYERKMLVMAEKYGRGEELQKAM